MLKHKLFCRSTFKSQLTLALHEAPIHLLNMDSNFAHRTVGVPPPSKIFKRDDGDVKRNTKYMRNMPFTNSNHNISDDRRFIHRKRSQMQSHSNNFENNNNNHNHNIVDDGQFPVWPIIIPNNCTYNKETRKMTVNHNQPRDKLVPYKPVKKEK